MRKAADKVITESLTKPARDAIWIALVAGSSVLFSLALACATPFAAIAAIAGIKMSRRDALILVAIAWLANQAVGYLVLGYPQTWDSFAWGAAIGIAAVLATFGVIEIKHRWGSAVTAVLISFLAAFAIYEGVLFTATAVLPSGEEAFSLAIVGRIFWVNVIAFAGLLALHRVAVVIGLLATTTTRRQISGVRA